MSDRFLAWVGCSKFGGWTVDTGIWNRGTLSCLEVKIIGTSGAAALKRKEKKRRGKKGVNVTRDKMVLSEEN